MAYDTLLTHTAVVQALVENTTPHSSSYAARYASKFTSRCLVQVTNGSEQFDDKQIGTVEKRYRVFFPPDVALVESDRIQTVTDTQGNTVASDLDVQTVRKINGINGIPHHIEADCRLFETT